MTTEDVPTNTPSVVAPAADPGPNGVGEHAAGSIPPKTAGTPAKSTPTTILELIEYAHLAKTNKLDLPRSVLRDLPLRPDDADAEEALVRRLATSDAFLAVPRRILLAVAELGSESPVRQRILKLMLAAMGLHPAFSSIGEQLVDPETAAALTSRRIGDAVRDVSFAELGVSSAGFRGKERDRLRENAVVAFALLSVLRGGWTFERFVQEVAPYLWTAPSLDSGRAPSNAATLVSARDPGALGLLATHFEAAVQAAEARTRAATQEAAGERSRAGKAEAAARDLTAALNAEQARTADLSVRLASLTDTVEAERTGRVVDRSHLADDYEALRTAVIRRLGPQLGLLTDGLHALRNGNTAVAEEFVDRSLTAIQAEVNRLKELGETR